MDLRAGVLGAVAGFGIAYLCLKRPAGTPPQKNNVRRIVTGHDVDGAAVVLSDSHALNFFEPPMRDGVQVNNVWRTFDHRPGYRIDMVADSSETCPKADKIPLLPPANGSTFRVISFSPEGPWIDKVARSKSNWLPLTDVGDGKKPRHPLMHKSETIDYAICLEGEIYLVLDKEEVLVREGDVVVQRATNHAWKNVSNAACKMAFVLIDHSLKSKM